MNCKLLLFDFDETLLQSDKTISKITMQSLKKCQNQGIMIGVSTSRSEQNSLVYLNDLQPDILISSGGALIKFKDEYIYKAEFSSEEIKAMICNARKICGNDCEITVDTITNHYWNYKTDPTIQDKNWGESIYTDFSDIGMLELCGTGVAMGNAIDEVKKSADCVIEDNDKDGISKFLNNSVLKND